MISPTVRPAGIHFQLFFHWEKVLREKLGCNDCKGTYHFAEFINFHSDIFGLNLFGNKGVKKYFKRKRKEQIPVHFWSDFLLLFRSSPYLHKRSICTLGLVLVLFIGSRPFHFSALIESFWYEINFFSHVRFFFGLSWQILGIGHVDYLSSKPFFRWPAGDCRTPDDASDFQQAMKVGAPSLQVLLIITCIASCMRVHLTIHFAVSRDQYVRFFAHTSRRLASSLQHPTRSLYPAAPAAPTARQRPTQ